MKRVLRDSRRILLVCAMSLLAYCCSVLINAWIFQRAETDQLEQFLTFGHSKALKNSAHAAADGLIGRIEIPRLGLSVIVMEGTSRTILGEAAGHIAGTMFPGQPGNIGISAHRDTFFRPLRDIRQNDTVMLTTPAGAYRYRVCPRRS